MTQYAQLLYFIAFLQLAISFIAGYFGCRMFIFAGFKRIGVLLFFGVTVLGADIALTMLNTSSLLLLPTRPLDRIILPFIGFGLVVYSCYYGVIVSRERTNRIRQLSTDRAEVMERLQESTKRFEKIKQKHNG